MKIDAEHEEEHECVQHRLRGVGGCTIMEGLLLTDTCSHQDGIRGWKVTQTSRDSVYWSWFMCNYSSELIPYYNCSSIAAIPGSWQMITKTQAIESLTIYNQ